MLNTLEKNWLTTHTHRAPPDRELEKQLKSTWVRKQSKLDSIESPTLGPHRPPTLNTLYLIPQMYSLSTPITYLPTPTKCGNTRSNRAKKPIPPVLDSYNAIINIININPELKECNPTKLRTLKEPEPPNHNKTQSSYKHLKQQPPSYEESPHQ
jgi:hypothetical protein